MMKFNPHGDAANYDTLVRLSKDKQSVLLPLIDNKGSMGKHWSRDRACAHMRYTEGKLMPVVSEFFKDLSKNGADIIDNYDGTEKEPMILPVTFPHILCNPNLGIAVGMASNICSFNLAEVCNYTAAYIKNKNVDIHEYIKGPDFSTGATLLYNKKQLNSIYATGKGSFKLRSVYEVDTKNRIILVKEIPYTTTEEAIIDEIITLCGKGKFPEIRDVRDESSNELQIAIDYKKGSNPDEIMNRLYKLTSLEDSYSCNFNMLNNNEPRVMGIDAILKSWISFRIETVKRTIDFDINKIKKQLHLLYGLEKILADIDKVIRIIRNTEKEADVIPNLMSNFDIDEIQAEYIAEIKLRNINKEYILNKIKNRKDLETELQRLQTLINSDTRIKTMISNQLKEIAKKYGKPRKTKILEMSEEELTANSLKEEVIEDYPVRAILSKDGYLKKIKLPIKKEIDIKLKDGDTVITDKEFNNKTEMILFTDKGNAYKMRMYELKENTLSDLGHYLPITAEFESDEKLIHVAFTNDYSEHMTFIFENGKGAKVPLKSYETKTKRKKLLNAYSLENKLIGIYTYNKDINIYCKFNDKRELVFNTKLLPVKTTKNTIGVQIARIPNGKLIEANHVEVMTKKYSSKVVDKIPCTPKKN